MAHPGTTAPEQIDRTGQTTPAVREMMTDVMRLGVEPVLRDRTAQIAALDEDFSNREAAMAERYRRALVSLDSAAARRRP